MRYAIISVVFLTMFVILTALLSDYHVTKWDSETFKMINQSSGNLIDTIMFTFSVYGRELVWTAIVVMLLAFGKSKGRKTAILLLIVFLISIPTEIMLKDVIHRPRPVPQFDKLLTKTEQNDYSYPSGHAITISAATCIFLSQYLAGKMRLISLIFAVEVVVCLSLIYVGAHYPMDIVGGILVGQTISFVVISCQRYLEPIFLFTDSIGKKRV